MEPLDDEARALKITRLRNDISFWKGDMSMGGPDKSREIVEAINKIRELEKWAKLQPKHG